jgi:hypothetical protein
MSSNGPLFQRSLAALALVKNAGFVTECGSRAGAIGPARRFEGGRSTAMSIQFAPEPDPTANIIELAEDQSAGPLPLGFEFEFFGVRYDRFCLSSDGFLSFSTRSPSRVGFDPQHDDTSNFIALGWGDVYRLGGKRVAYEVRGAGQRRRLVLSFAPLAGPLRTGAGAMAAQLVLHERTGMVDVHTTRHDGVAGEVALRLTTSPGSTGRPIDTRAH